MEIDNAKKKNQKLFKQEWKVALELLNILNNCQVVKDRNLAIFCGRIAMFFAEDKILP